MDAGECPFQRGTYTQRMQKQAAIMAALRKNLTPTNTSGCSHFPYCEGITPRVIGKTDEAAASGEFTESCNYDRQCRTEFVNLESFDYNKKTTLRQVGFSLNDIINEEGETVSNFYRRSEPLPNKGVGCPDDPNKGDWDNTFGLPDVDCKSHRRRAPAPPEVQRRMARRLMGVEHLFSDIPPGEEDSEFAKAARGFDAMIKAGNKSYTWYQIRAIRTESQALW